MADDSILIRIEQVLDSYRSYIKSHSGDIQLVKYQQGIVYVRLQGACVSCPASLFTIKYGIEEALKEAIPDIVEVIPVE